MFGCFNVDIFSNLFPCFVQIFEGFQRVLRVWESEVSLLIAAYSGIMLVKLLSVGMKALVKLVK